MGCQHDLARRHGRVRRSDPALGGVDIDDGGPFDDAASGGAGVGRQGTHVGDRMELGLLFQHEHGTVRGRRAVGKVVVEPHRQAGAARGIEFRLDLAPCVGIAGVQVHRAAPESAVDAERLHVRFDRRDGLATRLRDRSGDFGAPLLLDRMEPAADRLVEVAGGIPRVAAADLAGIEQDHRTTGACQQEGGGDARDPATDDRDIGRDVVLERRPATGSGRAGPDRGRCHDLPSCVGVVFGKPHACRLPWRSGIEDLRVAHFCDARPGSSRRNPAQRRRRC